MSKKGDSFFISMASFIEAVSIEKEIRLIDSHFKPQLLENAHFEAITNAASNTTILPLRTERLLEDITALNRATGLNYMPAKDNASDLPDGWQISEAKESVLMNNMELIDHRIIPSLNALRSWLKTHSSIEEAFEKRFSWDYRLVDFLEKRKS